eukprot:TRINITY_DN7740_c0_g2_i1.p1 TRINITY_DN7740_c0_g2~~TRINITY_DN7740_c0_g2_i1.p1  ORF type:complete len:726 (-),score=208.33 TRINITY_DN7740_c0_g2_i1:37-2214(-)
MSSPSKQSKFLSESADLSYRKSPNRKKRATLKMHRSTSSRNSSKGSLRSNSQHFKVKFELPQLNETNKMKLPLNYRIYTLKDIILERVESDNKEMITLHLRGADGNENKLDLTKQLKDYLISPDDIIVVKLGGELDTTVSTKEQFSNYINLLTEQLEKNKELDPSVQSKSYEEYFNQLLRVSKEYLSFSDEGDTLKSPTSSSSTSSIKHKSLSNPNLFATLPPRPKPSSDPIPIPDERSSDNTTPERRSRFKPFKEPTFNSVSSDSIDFGTNQNGVILEIEEADRKGWMKFNKSSKKEEKCTPPMTSSNPEEEGSEEDELGLGFGDSDTPSLLKLKTARSTALISSQRSFNKRKSAKAAVIASNILRPIKLNEILKSKSQLSSVVLSDGATHQFAIEKETDNFEECKMLEFAYIPDLYKLHFAGNAHLNWVGWDLKVDEFFLISIKETPENSSYRGLKNSKNGWDEFVVPEDQISKKDVKKESQFLKWLSANPMFLNCSFHKLKGESITNQIKNIEQSNRQEVKFMAISVLYAKAGQTEPLEMFKNTTEATSDKFWQFLKIMGVPSNYSSKSNINSSYWRNNNVIWYLAPKMDEEEHRRFIGNTQCALFYHDQAYPFTPFDPVNVNNMGVIPQFFIVVSPHEDKWRLGFFSRKGVEPFGPKLPADYLFDDTNLQDYLLTKVYNGYMMTRACPPINKLHEEPRKYAIKQLVEKNVPEKWYQKKKSI